MLTSIFDFGIPVFINETVRLEKPKAESEIVDQQPKDRVAFTERAKLKIDIEEIRERFKKAKTGTRITYHIGFLCVDAEDDCRLCEVRKLVSDWESVGLVSLVQRKIANYSYEYYAEVR